MLETVLDTNVGGEHNTLLAENSLYSVAYTDETKYSRS
jgi:hypothetical protein